MELIGRNREIKELKRYYDSNDPEFLVIYGRRRVGKTYLVKQFFEDRFFFYMTGVSPISKDDGYCKSLLDKSLERFHSALCEYNIASSSKPSTWMEAFDRLKAGIVASGDSRRKVVFLDELPWLDTPRSGFITALEYFWNSFASARRDVFLIACGSAASWITKKIFQNRGGLHNRITGRMLIGPFSLSDCEGYFRAKDIVISRREICEAYMIFGGIPYYLSYWNGRYGLPGNVDRIVFSEAAPLANEFQELYASLFTGSEKYINVVDALSSKLAGVTRDELLAKLKAPDGGWLSEILANLEQSGFVRHYSLFPGKQNGGIYQLIDNFSLFHRTFIKGNPGKNEHLWSELYNTPRLNAWSGFAFERLCLRHVDQIKDSLGITGVSSNIYAWRSKTSNPGAQIDLVIDRADGIVNLCEIKYAKYEYAIDKKYVGDLENKYFAFRNETRSNRTIHETLITTYGLKENKYANRFQSIVTADELFMPPRNIR